MEQQEERRKKDIGTDSMEEQRWYYDYGLARLTAESEKMFEV